MTPGTVFGLQFAVVVALVVTSWLVVRRVTGVRWAPIWWGVLAWPLSQVARFAVVIPLSWSLNTAFGGTSTTFLVLNTLLYVLTSGIFEECTRYVVMRYWATNLRQHREGVAFGLGHGGIEAFLIIGFAVTNAMVLLSAPQLFREQVAATSPEQLADFEQQLQTIQTVTVGLASLGVYERIMAVGLHVALSVLVLRAVRSRRLSFLVLAVVIHCTVNGVVVGLSTAGISPVVVELALTAMVLPMLWAVWRGPLSSRTFADLPPSGGTLPG